MRLTCTLLFSILTFQVFSQSGLFTYSDSVQRVHTIRATSADFVYFADKTFASYDSIVKVEFYRGGGPAAVRLQRKGIHVIYGGTRQPKIMNELPPASLTVERKDINQIMGRLTEFERARSTGKAFQILGTVGLSAWFIKQAKDVNELKAGNADIGPPLLAVPIVSCSLLGLGFIIDSSAGIHLRVGK